MKPSTLPTVGILVAATTLVLPLMAHYPIASHRYLADPTSLVTKDRVYHNRIMAKEAGIPTAFRRNLAVEEFGFNDDGTMQKVAYTTNGDWVRIVGVDFGSQGAKKFRASVATANPGGHIELRLGSPDGPFADAVKANRTYLLALEPDRLLAPFFREAGLEPKARPCGNWESGGLDGHTASHYLSALAAMIASGADTPDRELRRRLDYMVSELDRCQKASDYGYLGGVPGSRELWQAIAAGQVEAIHRKWVSPPSARGITASIHSRTKAFGAAWAPAWIIRAGMASSSMTSVTRCIGN